MTVDDSRRETPFGVPQNPAILARIRGILTAPIETSQSRCNAQLKPLTGNILIILKIRAFPYCNVC